MNGAIGQQSEHDAVLERGRIGEVSRQRTGSTSLAARVGEQRRDRVERVEPPTRLIERLADEVAREVREELLLILERVVPLRVRHRPRLEPDIDGVRHAAIRLVVAVESDLIDVWAVQIEFAQITPGQPPKLRDAANADLVAVLVLPDGKRTP